MEIQITVIARVKVPGVSSLGENVYKVKVSSVAEKGRANKEVIALLARHFEVKKGAIHILSGLTSSKKRIRIDI